MIGNELILNYYLTELLSVKQAYANNKQISAKPLLLVSAIDAIGNGLLKENKMTFGEIIDYYKRNTEIYNIKTPMQYPYYFMGSESFWHLKWKDDYIKTKSPSAKFIRDNIEYAYFDNALWDLLQDPEVRQQLREALVSHFLTR